MSATQATSETAIETQSARAVDMKLEVVVMRLPALEFLPYRLNGGREWRKSKRGDADGEDT